jgi:hypothetical protein
LPSDIDIDIDTPSPPTYTNPSQKPLVEIKLPTIAKIELSQEDLAELKRCLESKRMGPFGREVKQRKIIGMCGCGGVPDYIMTRYYEGAKVIEKYCSKCLEQYQYKNK